MDSDRQLALFTDRELTKLATPSNRRSQSMQMDGDCLQGWKAKVFSHQHQVRTNVPEKQAALFDDSSPRFELDTLDPFSLSLKSLSFWRFPTDSCGDACLYFVIDNALPLLLYVGETSRSNQRWKGVHDCKRYVENYQSLHYQYQIQTAVSIAFWWNAPVQPRPRQLLEQALIQKWRSPFNKESWSVWSAPFV